jgi:conjugative relaxase-like TrwC/TraI family protein
MVRPYAVPNGGGRYAEYVELDAAERAYWIGRGAEQIGLVGYVEPRQFSLLEQGLHPETKERLRPRISNGQTRNGKHYSQGRSLYDVVVMSPRSASIMGLFDDRVIEAHKESVRQIQSRIEEHASVRVRKGELNETDSMRPTQNIVAGVWLHERNRELEPLLHSHIVVLNMSFDPVEERWKALQPVEIYRHRWELSESYRHDLAQRLRGYGYELEPRELKDEIRYPRHAIKEREWGFEIAGVTPEMLDKFSERTSQRDDAIAKYRERYPEQELSERIVGNLVRENREPKHRYSESERQVVRQEQIEKLTPSERLVLHRLHEQSLEQTERHRQSIGQRLWHHATPEPEQHHERWGYGQRISM